MLGDRRDEIPLELPAELPDISAQEQARLVGISMLGVRLRSAGERDSHNREIELIPEPEAPGRLALTLLRLLGGMTVISVEHADCWDVLSKVAFDSSPSFALEGVQGASPRLP